MSSSDWPLKVALTSIFGAFVAYKALSRARVKQVKPADGSVSTEPKKHYNFRDFLTDDESTSFLDMSHAEQVSAFWRYLSFLDHSMGDAAKAAAVQEEMPHSVTSYKDNQLKSTAKKSPTIAFMQLVKLDDKCHIEELDGRNKAKCDVAVDLFTFTETACLSGYGIPNTPTGFLAQRPASLEVTEVIGEIQHQHVAEPGTCDRRWPELGNRSTFLYWCHAEKQLLVSIRSKLQKLERANSRPGSYEHYWSHVLIFITRPMCPDCTAFFQNVAIFDNVEIATVDPLYHRIFTPDRGTLVTPYDPVNHVKMYGRLPSENPSLSHSPTDFASQHHHPNMQHAFVFTPAGIEQFREKISLSSQELNEQLQGTSQPSVRPGNVLINAPEAQPTPRTSRVISTVVTPNVVSTASSPIRPLVLCGPSGAGKGTLLAKAYAKFPHQFATCVSHTTRKPRPGEQNAVHYHFVTKEDIEGLISENAFLEYAHVHGNTYGTSIQAVKDVADVGKVCVLEVDVQGAETVRKKGLAPICIFIQPPDLVALRKRLTDRNTETPETIELRMKNAVEEMAYVGTGFFDYELLNDDLERAFNELCSILKKIYPHIKEAQ